MMMLWPRMGLNSTTEAKIRSQQSGVGCPDCDCLAFATKNPSLTLEAP